MLFSGSCTVKPEPPPPIRDRNIIERGFCAPKRSFINPGVQPPARAELRDFLEEPAPAREVERQARRELVDGQAALHQQIRIRGDDEKPYAISWAGVQPASRMW